MLPERFPYMPYAPRMLPEYFPKTHGRHIRMVDENYFEHAQQIFGATECRSVCIRTEPNSQYAPRTHRMLPEYDPFAPRTPKFLFGKQTDWHSAQCDRAIKWKGCKPLSALLPPLSSYGCPQEPRMGGDAIWTEPCWVHSAMPSAAPVTAPAPAESLAGASRDASAAPVTAPAPAESLAGASRDASAAPVTAPAPAESLAGASRDASTAPVTAPAPAESLAGTSRDASAAPVTAPAPAESLAGASRDASAAPVTAPAPAESLAEASRDPSAETAADDRCRDG
ncbi:hypothetical protein GWK47_042369 [Chionoecetes opilio]|uniref:Uncharacterized protein n=1 Tax=Chionoecetes opilio TaxID=41210 RepID=A0A8J5CZ28_CHIOP|nr:hypothetical protein GWK47_042369 [Chionoecetes opilio]